MSVTMTDPAQTDPRRGRRTGLRWAAPVAAIALVAAGTFGANTLADADPGLPPRTTEQLVTDVLTAKVPGMSGTVSTTVQLGLPDLGGLGGETGGQPSVMDWLSGTHTARVWQAGEDKQRISVPDGDSEYGVYRTGQTTWLWSSAEKKATKITAKGGPSEPSAQPDPGQTPPTPQEAAKRLLAAVDATSTITPASNSTVAGRPAYTIVVTPTQTGSKVGRVEIAVDGETKVPLRFEVYGVNAADPSISVGFSSVDFSVPPDSVFAFTPPPGTKVETKDVAPGRDPSSRRGPQERGPGKAPAAGDHEVVGTGWQSVVVLSGMRIGDIADQPGLQQVLNGLPRVKGAWGSGRVFSGPLFSAVLTDDGRVAVGAVVPDLLYTALS